MSDTNILANTFAVIAVILTVAMFFSLSEYKRKHPKVEVAMQYKKDRKGICYAFYNDSAIATVPCDKVGL